MNLPTKITFSRIIAILVMIISLAILEIVSIASPSLLDSNKLTLGDSHINLIYLIIMVVFTLAALTDMIDGRLARKNNEVTTLGKFLDPVADKLLVNSLIIFLCVRQSYLEVTHIVFPLFCAILIILRDIVVDALRFIAANKKVVIAANIFGKAKTVAEMITLPFVLLNGWPFTYFDYNWNPYLRITMFLIYITTSLSILSGVIYVYQNRNVLKEN